MRPDIRKLEEGDLKGASEDKANLEEKQRKALRNKAMILKPNWFDKAEDQNWVFNEKYWQDPRPPIEFQIY